MDELRPLDATGIGVAQAISIFPGISRSGATIAAGLGVGMTRDDSARFAFLLAIPALFGAALVKVPDLSGGSLGAGGRDRRVHGVAGDLLRRDLGSDPLPQDEQPLPLRHLLRDSGDPLLHRPLNHAE